jgi:hypothetical protein
MEVYQLEGTSIYTFVDIEDGEEYIMKMIVKGQVLNRPKDKIRGERLMKQINNGKQRKLTDSEVAKLLLAYD